MNIVYKIINNKNNRFYIGSTGLKDRRMLSHFNLHKVCILQNNQFHKDIEKMNADDFEIEVIYESDDKVECSRIESKLIRENKDNPLMYNQAMGASGRRVFYYSDIVFIRSLYKECNLTCREAYKKYYSDVVTYRAFEKLWFGETYKDIMCDVYTEENQKWHYSKGQSRPCEMNGRSIYTIDMVKEIRRRKANGETKSEVYESYKYLNARGGFEGIWLGNTWKNII